MYRAPSAASAGAACARVIHVREALASIFCLSDDGGIGIPYTKRLWCRARAEHGGDALRTCGKPTYLPRPWGDVTSLQRAAREHHSARARAYADGRALRYPRKARSALERDAPVHRRVRSEEHSIGVIASLGDHGWQDRCNIRGHAGTRSRSSVSLASTSCFHRQCGVIALACPLAKRKDGRHSPRRRAAVLRAAFHGSRPVSARCALAPIGRRSLSSGSRSSCWSRRKQRGQRHGRQLALRGVKIVAIPTSS